MTINQGFISYAFVIYTNMYDMIRIDLKFSP